MTASYQLPVVFSIEERDTKADLPNKQLLLSIVRMGAMKLVPKKGCRDEQDDHLLFPMSNMRFLLQRCESQLMELPQPMIRTLKRKSRRSLNTIRIFQWNQLSQTLGTKNDKFVKCSPQALEWSSRRWRLLQEIVRYNPDIICLQEVDHFKFIEKALSSVGYEGMFVSKPDSPCLYLADNNGPDGCAIFYKTSQFQLDKSASHTLSVWGVESNQVILSLLLTHIKTGQEVCVATTHLKARTGDILTSMRNEQGKDILGWLQEIRRERPVILTGDFNADPAEPVYNTITGDNHLPLVSAYEEQEFTTWKIRETGEEKKVLDYIFHSPQLESVATLNMPSEEQVGVDRLPSLAFPSDHLSLVSDIAL